MTEQTATNQERRSVVTYADVKELLEGKGFGPYERNNPTVVNFVLERLMQERGIDTYDDAYEMLTAAGYELDFEDFFDYCNGETDLIHEEFVRGVVEVLELDEEEKAAFAWAILWGRVSSGEPPRA